MKKVFPLLCILIAVLLMAMTACTGSPTKDIGSDNDDSTSQATQKATAEPDQTAEADDNDDNSDVTNTDATVAAAYSRYVEAKGEAYDTLSAMIENNESLAMTAGMALLPVVMIDLAALPMTLLQGGDISVIEASAGIMGFDDISIEDNGQHFKMSYKTDEGTIVWEGDYDAATDSVTCELRTGDELSMIVEFVKGDDGYASQYYTKNEDGSFSLIKFMSEGEDVAIGLSDGITGEPASIFKNHPGSFDFAKDCDSYYIIVDGKGEAFMDGETTTFE